MTPIQYFCFALIIFLSLVLASAEKTTHPCITSKDCPGKLCKPPLFAICTNRFCECV
uniref:Nodule-specific cysteine-rich peptide G16 n=1 Tax=Pisum sativum TaxID=3888 RepID=A0A7T8DV39_PEA|nr:nodule-specific cysteine-rich peptide G16 [Pisum sativum]